VALWALGYVCAHVRVRKWGCGSGSSLTVKPQTQEHINDIAPEALARFVSRPSVIWRHGKKLPKSRSCGSSYAGGPHKICKTTCLKSSQKKKVCVFENSSTNLAKYRSITPEAMPDLCPLEKIRNLPLPNIVSMLRSGSAKADNIK
jgi:hypothetical protein